MRLLGIGVGLEEIVTPPPICPFAFSLFLFSFSGGNQSPYIVYSLLSSSFSPAFSDALVDEDAAATAVKEEAEAEAEEVGLAIPFISRLLFAFRNIATSSPTSNAPFLHSSALPYIRICMFTIYISQIVNCIH